MSTVVLFQPQIPQNTGNIVRTCSCAGAQLVLVRPLGFQTTNRWLKRSGLDYWEGVDVEEVDDLVHFLQSSHGNFYFFSSRGTRPYSECSFGVDPILVFGSETEGLPKAVWEMWPKRFLTIPMVAGARCLNLATSVGIGVYAARESQPQ